MFNLNGIPGMRRWRFDLFERYDLIFSEAAVSRWEKWISDAENAHIFFHPVPVRVWIDSYLPLRDIRLMFVWGRTADNGNEVFLPLVKWRRNWRNAFLTSIVPVGYSDFDYHDPIFLKEPDEDLRDAFWAELIEELTEELRNGGADDILIDGVTVPPSCGESLSGESLSGERHRGESLSGEWSRGEICPRLNLATIPDGEALLRFLRTSLRGDIRRQTRRMEELGELELREYSGWDEAEGTFADFLECHGRRWPNAYKAPRFHENLLRAGLGTGVVDFTSLNIAGRPAAWHLGFRFRGVCYYYMPCADPEFSRFSPVKVHLFRLMSRAIERGDRVWDHLRGDENYKEGWSDGFQYVYGLRIDSPRLSSVLRHGVSNLAHSLSRNLRNTPKKSKLAR